MLRADHSCCHHLSKDDEDTSQNCGLLRVENFEEDAGDDAEQRRSIKHEIEPVKDLVLDLVLLLNIVKVAVQDEKNINAYL